jgi:hypothetical protein
VILGPAVALGTRLPQRTVFPFEDLLGTDEGWATYNAHAWRRDYEGFLRFFFGEAFSEAHSTKQIDDAVGWGLETDPETLIATHRASGLSRDGILELCGRVRCPVMVIRGATTGSPARRRESAGRRDPGARLRRSRRRPSRTPETRSGRTR